MNIRQFRLALNCLALFLTMTSPASAQMLRISNVSGVQAIMTLDMAPRETMECREPYQPVKIVAAPFRSNGHMLGIHHDFFLDDIGNPARRVRRGVELHRVIETNHNGMVEDHDREVLVDITLLGCAFREHVSLTDGTVSMSGTIGYFDIARTELLSALESEASGLAVVTNSQLVFAADGAEGDSSACCNTYPWYVRASGERIFSRISARLEFRRAFPHLEGEQSIVSDVAMNWTINVLDRREE